MSWLFSASCPTCHLRDLLETPFCSAQIAALKTDIRIDNTHKCQIREMIALGDKLRTNNNVDGARFHLRNKFTGFGRRPDCIGRYDGSAGQRKQHLHFITNPLNTRTACHQRVLIVAFRAFFGLRHDMAAMMAGQAFGQPMFDHPRSAIGAVNPMTTSAAKRQRGKSPAIEKKQRLFALFQDFSPTR